MVFPFNLHNNPQIVLDPKSDVPGVVPNEQEEVRGLSDSTVPAPAKTIERPLPIVIDDLKQIPPGYEELCREFGCSQDYLAEVRLKQFLFDNEISLYNFEQVYAYLRSKCDRFELVNWTVIEHYQSDPVPERILLIAKKIRNAFPDAKFYISEIVSDPDPFLAVSVSTKGGAMRLFVVAVWDEPGFSG